MCLLFYLLIFRTLKMAKEKTRIIDIVQNKDEFCAIHQKCLNNKANKYCRQKNVRWWRIGANDLVFVLRKNSTSIHLVVTFQRNSRPRRRLRNHVGAQTTQNNIQATSQERLVTNLLQFLKLRKNGKVINKKTFIIKFQFSFIFYWFALLCCLLFFRIKRPLAFSCIKK